MICGPARFQHATIFCKRQMFWCSYAPIVMRIHFFKAIILSSRKETIDIQENEHVRFGPAANDRKCCRVLHAKAWYNQFACVQCRIWYGHCFDPNVCNRNVNAAKYEIAAKSVVDADHHDLFWQKPMCPLLVYATVKKTTGISLETANSLELYSHGGNREV